MCVRVLSFVLMVYVCVGVIVECIVCVVLCVVVLLRVLSCVSFRVCVVFRCWFVLLRCDVACCCFGVFVVLVLFASLSVFVCVGLYV